MVNQGWTRQCHFCMAKEIVDHLLFGFFLAMVICQVIVSAFGLTIPHDTTFGMFGAWIASFPVSQPKKGGALCGAAVYCTVFFDLQRNMF